MAQHPHEVLAHRVWQAFSEGDASALQELLAPDLVWRTHTEGRAEEFKGFHDALAGIARAAEGVDEMRSELCDVYSNDRGAVVWSTTHARRGEQILHSDYLIVLRVAGGRVAEVTAIPFDQRRTHHFWYGD